MGPPIARPLGGYRPQDVRERYRLDPECRDGRVGERADVLTLGEAVSDENPHCCREKAVGGMSVRSRVSFLPH